MCCVIFQPVTPGLPRLVSLARRMHIPGDAVSVAVHGYSPGINAVSRTLDVNAFSNFL